MASTLSQIILAALMLTSTLKCLQGLSPEEYDSRPLLGKIVDGLDIQQRLLKSELKKLNITKNVREVVRSLIELHVLQDKTLGRLNDSELMRSQSAIFDVILKDSCIWLKEKQVINVTSNCSLLELTVILVKINIYLTNMELYHDTAHTVRGGGQSTCSCAWMKNELLRNDCTTSLHSHLMGVDTIADECNPDGEGTFCDHKRNAEVCIPPPEN